MYNSGFITALEAENTAGEVINIGNNFEISIGDTVAMIAELMQADIEIATDDARLRPDASEVERLWADNSKAARLLGWVPFYAGNEGLRRGQEETIAWFNVPENLKNYKLHYNV